MRALRAININVRWQAITVLGLTSLWYLSLVIPFLIVHPRLLWGDTFTFSQSPQGSLRLSCSSRTAEMADHTRVWSCAGAVVVASSPWILFTIYMTAAALH